jgi:phospholipase C
MKLTASILFLTGAGAIAASAQASSSAPTPSFKHIVVIVQENRTPDNLFQGLCAAPYGSQNVCSTSPTASQYDIQTSNWLDKSSTTGATQPATVPLANSYDLSHAHSAFTVMCDADPATGACKMDGAGGIACSGTCPAQPQYRYVDNSTGILNPYLDMATAYGWANYMFQTNQGPSFPAHQFLFGGTSAPSAADDAAGIFASENMTGSGTSGTNASAGCTAPAGTTVQVIDPTGENKNNKIYPCFEHQTMADILPPNITWRYYTPSAGSIWTAPNAIQHICQSSGPGGQCLGQDWTNNVDLTPADVLNDVNSCNLRSVSWVVPTGANSDHASVNDGGGPSWVAAIVNAIGASTACDNNGGYWQDTAIFITWDDWGGWYDHETPTFLAQPEGDYQYGFRVPLVVVSAYTPAGYIDNQRHDFGSLLRFIERNFGVPMGALNFADARAKNDLGAFFYPGLAPRSFQNISAPKSANFFLHDKRKATDPDDDK